MKLDIKSANFYAPEGDITAHISVRQKVASLFNKSTLVQVQNITREALFEMRHYLPHFKVYYIAGDGHMRRLTERGPIAVKEDAFTVATCLLKTAFDRYTMSVVRVEEVPALFLSFDEAYFINFNLPFEQRDELRLEGWVDALKRHIRFINTAACSRGVFIGKSKNRIVDITGSESIIQADSVEPPFELVSKEKARQVGGDPVTVYFLRYTSFT